MRSCSRLRCQCHFLLELGALTLTLVYPFVLHTGACSLIHRFIDTLEENVSALFYVHPVRRFRILFDIS